VTRLSFVIGLSLFGLSLPACVRTPAQRVADAQRSVRANEKPDKLVERGKMFAQLGDYNRASQYFSAALDNGADKKTVLPLLMHTYIASQRYRVAIEVGKNFLQKDPNDYHLRYLVGTLYAAIGDTSDARAEFEQVLVTNPDHAQAHYALAVLLRDSDNDWVKADYHFRQYLKLAPKGPHAEEARASLLKRVP
jgi:tetratricopeptide (TPR) repeat protein